MLIKTAIVMVAVYLLYRLAKYAIKKKLEKLLNRTMKPEIKNSGQLVQCGKCGTWVNEQDAIKKRGLVYCSRTCLPD